MRQSPGSPSRGLAWARISLFPLVLAGLVIASGLALNLAGPRYDAESVRIEEASRLASRAREAYTAGDWPGARDHATSALALQPGHINARQILGLAYMNLNQAERAESEFFRALALAKDDRNATAWAHNNLGVLYQRAGRPDMAAREYQTAIELDPSNPNARANLSSLRGFSH